MKAIHRLRIGRMALAVLAFGLIGCGDRGPQCPVPVKGLPILLDLGSAKVKPSRDMAPVFEALKKDFAGKLQVECIDVDEHPEMADRFKLERVPAQVFYDAAGKERFRHEGAWTREEILAKWKELGVVLAAPSAVPAPAGPSK